MRVETEVDALGWGGEREAPIRWWWLGDAGEWPGSKRGMALAPAPLSDVLASMHPAQLAAAFEEHMTKVDKDLVGFVMAHEGWALIHSEDDHETEARAFAAAKRREIWKQPDREEVRTVFLQMLTGQSRSVIRVRGEQPCLVGVPQYGAGEIPTALRRLAVTLRRRKYGRRG